MPRLCFCLMALVVSACALDAEPGEVDREVVVLAATSEGFESGSKTSYAAGAVSLASGTWSFDDALVGTLAGDAKNGARAARVRNTGKLTMGFDRAGAGTFSVRHAAYGSDSASRWQLYFSTNGGGSWSAAAAAVTSTSGTLATSTFTIARAGAIRFELRKLDGGSNRLNFDDVVITDPGSSEPPDPDPTDPPADGPGADVSKHTALGLPSAASTSKANDYLAVKTQYVLSYNASRKTPNWVSWELNDDYLGSADRQDNYRSDSSLPSGMAQATPGDYSGSGWDRGHMCPSADRTASTTANGQTFLLTNMVPQATNNNGGPWAKLESYSRSLAQNGSQLYVVAGGVFASSPARIGNGVAVPTDTWKVVVVLSGSARGPAAVTSATRVIAVRIPNRDSAVSASDTWQRYRVSVDAIEAATGLDLLADLPASVENVVEARVDAQ
jgi:endonuclease G, mitochondrial